MLMFANAASKIQTKELVPTVLNKQRIINYVFKVCLYMVYDYKINEKLSWLKAFPDCKLPL
jgi:hypothetical protein